MNKKLQTAKQLTKAANKAGRRKRLASYIPATTPSPEAPSIPGRVCWSLGDRKDFESLSGKQTRLGRLSVKQNKAISPIKNRYDRIVDWEIVDKPEAVAA